MFFNGTFSFVLWKLRLVQTQVRFTLPQSNAQPPSGLSQSLEDGLDGNKTEILLRKKKHTGASGKHLKDGPVLY